MRSYTPERNIYPRIVHQIVPFRLRSKKTKRRVTAATSDYSCGANSMNTLQSSSTTFTSPFTFNFQSCSVTMNIISNK